MNKFKSTYILKAHIALVLALLMVFGTVATSFAAVVDDIADSGAEADIADSGYVDDDLAESGSFPSAGSVVYLEDINSWSNAYLYMENSSGTALTSAWPGTKMTYLGLTNNSHGIFAVTVPSGTPSKIIFNNGNSGNANQTADLNPSWFSNNCFSVNVINNNNWGNDNIPADWSLTITKPTLSLGNVSVEVGSTSTATATVSNSVSVGKYTWSSSATAKATVSGSTSTATVTGVAAGTSTLTVKAWADKPYSNWSDWQMTDATYAFLGGTKSSTITVTAPACTPTLQTSAGADLGATKSIYKNQTLVFKTNDPSSHTATYTVYKDGSTTNTASTYLNKYNALANNTEVTFTGSAAGTYVVTSTCSGGGSDSVTITVTDPGNIYFKHSTTKSDVSGGATPSTSGVTKGQITMTYDATASAALSGGKASHVVYKASITNWAGSSHYWVIYDSSRSANRVYTTAITSNASRLSGTGVSTTAWSSGQSGNVNLSSIGSATTVVYYDVVDGKFYADLPIKVTYQGYCASQSKNVGTAATEVKAYGTTATSGKTITATGYTQVTPVKWYTTNAMSTEYTFPALSGNITTVTIYTPMTANPYTVTLDANTNGGKIKKTSTSAEANTATFTHTYGVESTIADQYSSVIPPTGYQFDGWYDQASGGTKYTSVGATAITAAKTYYAHYTEVKAGATVKAYTDGSASSTGGTVKVGSGSAGATATISNSTFGYTTASPAVIRASTATGYTFTGWETGGTYGSHVKLYIDAACQTEYVKATHGSDYSTVYAKTDGYTANTMTTANTEIHALFETAKYTITNNGPYYKNGAAAYASGTTGGTFTVSSTGSLSYNTNLTLTATAASGYAVEGVYWSNNGGSTWTRVTTTNTTSNGYVTVATNNTFKVTDNFTLKAQFVQLKKLSAFDSYEMKNSQVIFVTAPPKSITVKHTDAAGTATTYTYTYDGTKAKGNPYTPEVPNASGTLAIGNGTYGQGNYIQFFAGDEITLTYSAMASSELLKGVFYNNGTEFYVTKPTTAQFVAHTYDNTHALYMNSAYYASVPSGLPTTTVDQDAHSIKFTGTQDYKNIDVEIATKRKVYFSDYTNAVIHSKNMDDYYYDNEALSVTGDQLTVKAAGSATQTNTIDKNNVKFYMADANGQPTGSALSGYTVAYSSGSSAISNNGTSDSTNYIIISGNMPAYDLYIDLGISSSYTLKLGSKVLSDPFESKTRLAQVASIKIKDGNTDKLTAIDTADVTTSSTNVAVGTSITLTSTFTGTWGDYYMFVGWYWGNSDNTAPDYEKGFISDKATLSYKPKKGGTIWAVGTRALYINGSKYITGKSTNWYSESGTQKNLRMEYDAVSKRYYWEITDTMFASAGSDFKTWQADGEAASTSYGKYYMGGDNNYYWNDNADQYHGKAFFQILDQESGNANKTIWDQITSYKEDTPANGPTYGKIYPQWNNDSSDNYNKRHNGQGFINFNETGYPGYSSPLRICYDPNASGNARLTVEATPIYCDIYVSNGYDVGSTVKTDAVTVEPVVNGVVKTSGQTGYFDVNAGTVYTPDAEGNVTKYSPKKKGATVRITKKAGGSDKIAAFLIYDLDTKTVRAEKNITKGTASGGKTPYYIDLTLSTEKQRLYICPIIEESGAKVTITFDATQLNRAQWGDIVTAYAWYKTTNGPAIGAYPGQPMIPSDDMSTWTTSFNPVKNGNEVAGITFSNYVDGKHSWLGCTTDNGGVPSGGTNVMGSVSYGGSGTSASPTTVSIADDGLIKQYNYIESGTNKEYSRANYKAQTYDYHEPVALYDRYKNEESIDITFQMKDGNSSLISWRHSNLILENEIPDGKNILNLPDGWTPLRWEYLTNAKGDKYVDMNGREIDTKPTASFYVASKGLVVYQGSKMNYVFHGGHDYEMKGYTGTYSNGSYSRSALSYWSSDITYGGTANLDMKYAVQWYVYDAQGNYVTTVLSAGIADLASGTTDTYIAKQLEDMGYAVDGKSVAICYDKPRYMYGDWTVTNSANNINSGTDFDAYRFEGQWIANASTAMTRVNVEVAMMTDSGEVLAGSNVSGYGSATANWASGVTFTKTHTLAGDNSWAETATSEAKLNGIELTATSQNFIGWYYYDANTNEFTKATYKEATGFRPNYSTKDITFYAVYRASAIYEFVYTGREGSRTYSVSGNDLTASEMEAGANQNKVQYANHSEDILNKIPVGIGIFKKDIVFSSTTVGNSTKDNSDEYILRMSGFTPTMPTYTLSVYYKDANENLKQIDTSAVYNGSAINLTAGSFSIVGGGTKPAGEAVTSYYGTGEHKFIGWYEYDGTNIGELLSTQANYGMMLTKTQKIIAVYENDDKTLPTDGWQVFIDENQVNKELTSSTTGVFYNDTIVRVRNSSNVTATLPSGAKIGVLVITKPTGATKEPDSYTTAQLTSLVGSITSGQTKTAGSGLRITNMQATTQTNFNRTDIAVRADYAKTNGAQYCVYAYFYDGSSYHFSAASAVKTYE